MPTDDKKPKPPCFVEVAGLNDLARLACALERVAIPVFGFEVKGAPVLAIQLDLFRGTPVIYYVKSEEIGGFLGYRNTGGRETVELSRSIRDAANTYAPIILIKKIPHIFEEGFDGRSRPDKYVSMQVGDLASLCKIALYKIVFEETPLPLFVFPQKNRRWILGAFARLDEADDSAVFFNIPLDDRPNSRFVKYSSMKTEKTELTDRIDEHGYVYGKIVELTKPHPMVDL